MFCVNDINMVNDVKSMLGFSWVLAIVAACLILIYRLNTFKHTNIPCYIRTILLSLVGAVATGIVVSLLLYPFIWIAYCF